MALRDQDTRYDDEQLPKKPAQPPVLPGPPTNTVTPDPFRPGDDPPQPPPQPKPQGIDWSQGPWDAAKVQSYFDSRGVKPYDTSVGSWVGYWNDWGKDDPGYYMQRLSNADEFTGKPPGNSGAGGGSGGGNATSSAFDPSAFMRSIMSMWKPDPRGDELFNFLMGRAKQSLNVSPNDPVIKAQSDAYNAEQTRTNRRYLMSRAEQAGPYGGMATRNEARGLAEKSGQARGTFVANLMSSELQSKRQEILQALSGAAGVLSSQQQVQLQQQLATIDAALKRYSLDLQNDQFGKQLGQNESQFARNLSQRSYEYDTDMDFKNSPQYKG